MLDKISDLIAKRRQQLEKLDELVKARFVEMFGGGNFPLVKIGDVVATNVTSAKKCLLRPIRLSTLTFRLWTICEIR